MASEDIESPPYPGEGSTADVMFNHLKALHVWLLHYRDNHNTLIGQELIPAVRAMPEKAAYVSQPIMSQFGHLIALRRIREQWDQLVRTYENDWDYPPCLRSRVMLFQMTAILLNSAFTPFEYREARQQRELEELQRTFERIHAALMEHLEVKRNVPNPEEPA